MKRIFYKHEGRIVATIDGGKFGLAVLTFPVTGQTKTVKIEDAKCEASSTVEQLKRAA